MNSLIWSAVAGQEQVFETQCNNAPLQSENNYFQWLALHHDSFSLPQAAKRTAWTAFPNKPLIYVYFPHPLSLTHLCSKCVHNTFTQYIFTDILYLFTLPRHRPTQTCSMLNDSEYTHLRYFNHPVR